MFGSKAKHAPKAPPKTLQQLQQDFQQKTLELGDFTHQEHQLRNSLTKVQDKIEEIQWELVAIGNEGKAVAAKLQAEVKATAAKGETDAPTPA